MREQTSVSSTLRSPLGKLRMVGKLEGVSFLLLLSVGMPLKYIFSEPFPVRILGSVHGLLFVWLVLLLVSAVFAEGWSMKRGAVVFLASLFPFGPFIVDRRFASWQREFEESRQSE